MSFVVLKAHAGSTPATMLLALLVAAPGLGHAQHTLTMSQALDIAVTRAPEVTARQASAEGAAAAQVSAGQLPDPRLVLGLDNLPVTGPDPFSLTSDSMTQGKIGWAQEMLNAAKRKARSEVAQALTARERALLAAERQIVKRATALAWLNRYFAEKRLALFGALERENRVLQDTVNARVAAGRALPVDAIAARQEALQLADRRDRLELDVERAQAALRRWVGDAADATLAGEPQIPTLDAAHLRESLARHVELAVYEPMAQMAAAEAREAEAAKRGDWSWEVSYGKRSASFGDMVSVQVALELPLFNATRRDPQVFAKRKEVQRVEAEREEMLRKHAEEIETELATQEELSRRLARLRDDGLPLADERVRLLMASYEAKRADLNAVLAARAERVETRLKVIEAEAALAGLRARLAYLFTEHRP